MVGGKWHVIAAADLVLQLAAIRTKGGRWPICSSMSRQVLRARLNRARLLTGNLPFTQWADLRQAAMAATLHSPATQVLGESYWLRLLKKVSSGEHRQSVVAVVEGDLSFEGGAVFLQLGEQGLSKCIAESLDLLQQSRVFLKLCNNVGIMNRLDRLSHLPGLGAVTPCLP